MSIYRPGQGVQARWVAAGAAITVSAFGAYRLFLAIQTGAAETGGQVAAYWAGGVFLVLCALTAVIMLGLTKAKAVTALNDLLIDTQAELAKVVWPTREQLVKATTAVITTVVVLGVFLFVVDWALLYVVRVFITK